MCETFANSEGDKAEAHKLDASKGITNLLEPKRCTPALPFLLSRLQKLEMNDLNASATSLMPTNLNQMQLQ